MIDIGRKLTRAVAAYAWDGKFGARVFFAAVSRACLIAVGIAGAAHAPHSMAGWTRVINDELTECRTSVENLSKAIEKYLDSPDMHRVTPPGDFVRQLKALLPQRNCPDDLVDKILKANRYLQSFASGYTVSRGHDVGYRFGSSTILVVLGWSRDRQRFLEEGMYGKIKKTVDDWR